MVVSRLLGAGHGVKRETPATKQPPAALARGHFLSPGAGATLPSPRIFSPLDAESGPRFHGQRARESPLASAGVVAQGLKDTLLVSVGPMWRAVAAVLGADPLVGWIVGSTGY